MRKFFALVHKDADSDYGVSFPDFPGCITAGTSLDDAFAMAVEALGLHIEGMVEDGDAIPEPSSLEAIMAERESRSAVAILIAGPPVAVKAVRVNITMAEDLLNRVDHFAEDHGLTRSGFLASAARKVLDEESVHSQAPDRALTTLDIKN